MGVGSRGRHRCHRRDRASLHVPHHEYRLRRPQHRRARLREPVPRPRHPLQLGPDQVVQDRPHPEHPPCRRAGVPRPSQGARARRTARPVQQGLRDALPARETPFRIARRASPMHPAPTLSAADARTYGV